MSLCWSAAMRTHTVLKHSSHGADWKEGSFGALGRFLFPVEQSWDKGQPWPCQTQPHSSGVPQIRQAPNVSSCWAGKMIPNSSINRGKAQNRMGLTDLLPLGACPQCDALPKRRQEPKQLSPLLVCPSGDLPESGD